MAPVTLPRYVMFKGDNGQNLALCHCEGHPYLMFNTTNRDLWGAHEVLPLPEMESVVRIKALYNNRWWRRSPNWIWADQEKTPDADKLDCLFKVTKVGPKKVVLQNLGNDNYVKRLTTEGKDNALNAAVEDYRDNVWAQLEVSEALLNRRVFDVEYLMDQLDTKELNDQTLGSASAWNDSNRKTDVAATITYEKTESRSWSNSVSITTGMSVTITAGIPEVAEASTTVSTEITSTTEMGKENSKTTTFSSTFTVKDMEPGEKVTIRVSGTKAIGTVPYKYKYQDTRVDGFTMPEDSGVDGIFKGVQVYDIKWKATNPQSGSVKEVKKTG